MNFIYQPLEGRFVRLEPFTPELKSQVRVAIDCDPDAWAIMPMNPTGEGFEPYWAATFGAPDRRAYAIRQRSDGRVVGMSTFYMTHASEGGIEIGTTFLRPEVRAGYINPETKLLMLDHAFASGVVRVQFRVDTRNKRSQAAVTRLGAVKEGILRRDRRTWTGYIRDTVYFSILADEWPAVKAGLEKRLSA
jgi:N-acetyltransferase